MLPQNTSLVGRIKITFKLESPIISDYCLGVFGIMTNEIDTIFSFIGRNGATSYGQHQHLLIPIEKYHNEILFFTMIQFFSFIDSTFVQNLNIPISIRAHNNLLHDNISQFFFTLIVFVDKKDNNKKKKWTIFFSKNKKTIILIFTLTLNKTLQHDCYKFHSIFDRQKCILHLSNNCVLASFICWSNFQYINCKNLYDNLQHLDINKRFGKSHDVQLLILVL